jgi:hypothetical protein
MAKRNDDGGHPIFWLLLGFLSGVVGTLGLLLLLSKDAAGTGEGASAPPADNPVLTGAPPPRPEAPAPQVPPAAPEAPPPTVQAAPAPQPAPAPKAAAPAPPPPARNSQIEEDAAAAGMTSRTR